MDNYKMIAQSEQSVVTLLNTKKSEDVVEFGNIDNVTQIEMTTSNDPTDSLPLGDVESNRRKEINPDGLPMLQKLSTKISRFVERHKPLAAKCTRCTILAAILVYIGYSFNVKFGDEASLRLLIFALFGFTLLSWKKLKKRKFIKKAKRTCRGAKPSKRMLAIIRWFLYLAMVTFMCVYLGLTVLRTSPRNLRSLGGIVCLMSLLILTSTNVSKIQWHTVFWGFSLQFLFAVFILRTSVGSYIVLWISARFNEFMKYSHKGARFIFGTDYRSVYFAFVIMPQIIVFCAFINVLQYLGVLHFVNTNIGKILAFCMGTSTPEAINAAANMFLGGNEVLVIIKYFLNDLTDQQLFCTYVNGLASIGGSALVSYVGYGVPVEYLIAASVMSAPAALASAKLNMPDEVPTDPLLNQKAKNSRSESEEKNIIHALTRGASVGLTLVASIGINLIVFFAMLEFGGKTVEWFGERVGVHNLNLEVIASYVMWPFAYVMGVDRKDCLRVGGLLGVRTLTAPGPAYILIGHLFDNKRAYNSYSQLYNDTTFIDNGDIFLPKWNVTLDGILTDRSEVIATYALCGFACLTAMGTSIGAYSTLTPRSVGAITRMSLRAVTVGTFASYFTACFAGLLTP